MIYQCYSVFDAAVGAYMPPFYAKSRGEAIRMFMDTCGRPDHSFYKYASDYSLHQCGEFEDGSGIFSSRPPERVITATECLPKSPVTVDFPSGDLTSGTAATINKLRAVD